MSSFEYSAEERGQLLSVAHRSIEHGLGRHGPFDVKPADFPPHLSEKRACFVTLYRHGELRGCTGTIAARSPLVVCVSEHAFTSAFRDLRFPPLASSELEGLEISISVLSAPEEVVFEDEDDLIAKLRPGLDGVIFQSEGNLGTLLPSVWEALPDPRQFLRQLKRKAGFRADYWSAGIRISRYTTEQFE